MLSVSFFLTISAKNKIKEKLSYILQKLHIKFGGFVD